MDQIPAVLTHWCAGYVDRVGRELRAAANRRIRTTTHQKGENSKATSRSTPRGATSNPWSSRLPACTRLTGSSVIGHQHCKLARKAGHSLPEEPEVGAAEHLALEHLDAVDASFDCAGAPGEGQSRDHGVQVAFESGREEGS